jgi:hypothetical protein
MRNSSISFQVSAVQIPLWNGKMSPISYKTSSATYMAPFLDSANDEADQDAAGLPIHDINFFEEVIMNYTADQIDRANWTEQADYIG